MTTACAPVLVVCPPERLAEMFRLRSTVWIGEGADPAAFPGGEWRDERDAWRLHWIVLNEDRVVATASLSVHASLADVEEGEVYLRAGLSSPGPVAAPGQGDGGGGLSGTWPRPGTAGRSGCGGPRSRSHPGRAPGFALNAATAGAPQLAGTRPRPVGRPLSPRSFHGDVTAARVRALSLLRRFVVDRAKWLVGPRHWAPWRLRYWTLRQKMVDRAENRRWRVSSPRLIIVSEGGTDSRHSYWYFLDWRGPGLVALKRRAKWVWLNPAAPARSARVSVRVRLASMQSTTDRGWTRVNSPGARGSADRPE